MVVLVFILIAVFVFIIAFKRNDGSTGKYSCDSQEQSIDAISKIANSAYGSTTSAGARKRLEKLESVYESAKLSGESDKVLSHILFEIDDVKELVDNLEYSEWEEKANQKLSDFLYAFEYVTSEEIHSFHNIDDVLKMRNRCMHIWHEYWNLLKDVHVRVDPKGYMADYLGSSFEPCMLESTKLKKRLDDATEIIKPEHMRKMKLYNDIIKTVADSGSIMQCELKKQQFDNASQKEVEFCYNDLIASNRLVKVKIGSRYFVSLSDKEKERHPLIQSV